MNAIRARILALYDSCRTLAPTSPKGWRVARDRLPSDAAHDEPLRSHSLDPYTESDAPPLLSDSSAKPIVVCVGIATTCGTGPSHVHATHYHPQRCTRVQSLRNCVDAFVFARGGAGTLLQPPHNPTVALFKDPGRLRMRRCSPSSPPSRPRQRHLPV